VYLTDTSRHSSYARTNKATWSPHKKGKSPNTPRCL